MRSTTALLLALLVPGRAASGAPEETVEETWRRVAVRSALQVGLPLADGAAAGAQARGAASGEPAEERARQSWFEDLGAVAEKLLWGGIVAAVLLSIYVLVRALMGYQRNVVLEPEAAAPALPASRRPPDLAAAEAAAGAGRFDDALHLLLLHALERLASRGTDPLPPAATGREACRILCPEMDRRAALEELVGLVEASLFGGRPASEGAWLRGRDRFAALEAAPAA